MVPHAPPPARLVFLGFGTATFTALAALTACLTDPPPDLPLQTESPTILQETLQPAAGVITSNPPDGFVVPIQVADPTATCYFSVFDETNTPYITCSQCDMASSASVVTIKFGLTAPLFDPTECHTIKFTVASSFSPNDRQCHSGTDIAIWYYRPDFGSCVAYDAAALGDGSFPDASTDGLPLVPDSGGDP